MAFDKPHATAVKMNVAKEKTNPIVNNTDELSMSF